jgi:hypothetical protein
VDGLLAVHGATGIGKASAVAETHSNSGGRKMRKLILCLAMIVEVIAFLMLQAPVAEANEKYEACKRDCESAITIHPPGRERQMNLEWCMQLKGCAQYLKTGNDKDKDDDQ